MVQARQMGESGAQANAPDNKPAWRLGSRRPAFDADHRARMRLTALVAQSTQTLTCFGRSAGILG